MSAKRKPMILPPNDRKRLPIRRATPARRGVQSLLAAVIAFVASGDARGAPASTDLGVSYAPPTELRPVSKRWWLNFWCHSMQEQCFVLWMNFSTGSTAWQHVMPSTQVNALYAWWLAEIWTGSKG